MYDNKKESKFNIHRLILLIALITLIVLYYKIAQIIFN